MNKIALAILAAGGLVAVAVLVSTGQISNWIDPYSSAKSAVKEKLVDPASSQFKNVSKKSVAYCGEVNAKNSMGGYTGFRRFHAFPDPDRRSEWVVMWAAERKELGRFAEIKTEMVDNFCD